jgi:hypothetical protein
MVLLAALVATCTEEKPPTGVATSDAGFGGAPGRNVVTPPAGYRFDGGLFDGAAPGMGSNPIGGGTGGTGGTGGPRVDARNPDGPVDRATTIGCDLVRQDCGDGQACYPGQAGYGVCSQAGSLGEDTPCAEHEFCAAGLLCVDAFGAGSKLCARICSSTSGTPCPVGRLCQTFPSSTVGTCSP